MGSLTGALKVAWNGGRTVASNGYVLIRVGKTHHLADVRGYAYEHRLVAERMLGRRLHAGEVVHHRNGAKSDNRPENLEVLTHWEHHAEHRTSGKRLRNPGEQNPHVECACGCGEKFRRFDEVGRPRRFVSGHNPNLAPTTDAILRALRSGPVQRSTLVAECSTSVGAVASCLSKLKRKGLVENVGKGFWRACG